LKQYYYQPPRFPPKKKIAVGRLTLLEEVFLGVSGLFAVERLSMKNIQRYGKNNTRSCGCQPLLLVFVSDFEPIGVDVLREQGFNKWMKRIVICFPFSGNVRMIIVVCKKKH
jgi:hypothetical protein